MGTGLIMCDINVMYNENQNPFMSTSSSSEALNRKLSINVEIRVLCVCMMMRRINPKRSAVFRLFLPSDAQSVLQRSVLDVLRRPISSIWFTDHAVECRGRCGPLANGDRIQRSVREYRENDDVTHTHTHTFLDSVYVINIHKHRKSSLMSTLAI